MTPATRMTQGAGSRRLGPAGPLLAVTDLSVRFGRLAAVSGVSLTVDPGEFLGVVGESGSGKTVTARALLGLLPAHARVTGSVRFHDEELLAATPRRMRQVRGGRIGLVFQDALAALDPVYTVGDQLVEALLAHQRVSRQAARARAAELLEEVRMPHPAEQLDRYPHQLSGGMRQRVVIASALIADPELIVADEPTSALDVTVQRQILDLLAEVCDRRRAAVVLISHDLAVVAETCDRVAVFYGGTVVEEAPALPLFEQPRHPYTRALLNALPRLGGAAGFEAIAGEPIQVRGELDQCPFAPRCPLVVDRCRHGVPIEHRDGDRRHRCLRVAEGTA